MLLPPSQAWVAPHSHASAAHSPQRHAVHILCTRVRWPHGCHIFSLVFLSLQTKCWPHLRALFYLRVFLFSFLVFLHILRSSSFFIFTEFVSFHFVHVWWSSWPKSSKSGFRSVRPDEASPFVIPLTSFLSFYWQCFAAVGTAWFLFTVSRIVVIKVKGLGYLLASTLSYLVWTVSSLAPEVSRYPSEEGEVDKYSSDLYWTYRELILVKMQVLIQ